MVDDLKTDKPTPVESKRKNGETDNCMPDLGKNISNQSHVNITDMIRSLQRTEGHSDCFRTGMADCDQLECAWRRYCLKNPESLPPDKDC